MQVSRLCIMGAWTAGLLGAAAVGRSWILKEPAPLELGNHQALISKLQGRSEGKPVSFAVVGDSHGSAVFNEILNELRKERLDFIVHLGDFAPVPTHEGHSLFMEQVKENLGQEAPPMLLVMGNHDVDLGFPIPAFEELYGPSSYSFQIGGNFFVVVRNCLPRSLRHRGAKKDDWTEELRRLIQEKGCGAKRIFVFMHAPPMDPLSSVHTFKLQRFQAKWSSLGVDYIMAGHLHQYSRSEIGPTVLLVSGGGGGTLRRVRSGRFHHALILRVAGAQITEELVVVGHPWAPLWRLKRATVVGISSLLFFLMRERVGENPLFAELSDGPVRKNFHYVGHHELPRPRILR